MWNLLRRLPTLAAIGLCLIAAPLRAQVPPPVPALPDTERRTQYSISATTCACAVNFAIFGSGTDVDSWIEVWIGATRYLSTDPTFGWSLSSATGTLATIPRPITNAVLTFTRVQTGTVQIVGAERPRRLSQFQENRGVAARDLNQVLTDLTAQNRETWDRTNDITGRTLRAPPGETFPTLPSATSRAGGMLAFDGSGNGVIQPNVPAGSIPTNSITNSLLAQMPANTTKCNNTAGVATPIDCNVGQMASMLGLYSTRTAAAAATIPATIQSVQTAGYAAVNDGGAALYTKVGSSQTCGFTSADGAFWQLAGNQFSAKQCGAKGDGTDDTTALQNAVTWAQTAPQPLLIIDSTSSCYKTSAVLNVTAAISIHGVNRDTSYICPSNTSQNAFDINTNAAVHFSNFRINPSVTPVAGYCITVTGASQNQRSTFADMFLQGCFAAMYMNSAALWKIDHLYCSAPVASCITVVLGGDSTIVNSLLTSLNGVIFSPTTTSGGLRIENTKIVSAGSGTGVNLILPAGGAASDLIIVGSSIENMTNGVLLQKGSGTSFTNVNISGNNFENTTCINTDANAGWLSEVNVSGNVCQISGGPGMAINAGTGWTVVGNTLYGAGTGIVIGSNMTAGVFASNTFQGVTTNYTSASTTATINDQQGMALANLPPAAANGSQIFVTNGAPASSPCTGASTGSMAFRQNGAWKCF